MATKMRHGENLMMWDGQKAVTIWGDEGWTITSGTDKERPDTESFYTARVPIVFRGMHLRANCVASIPFDLVKHNPGGADDGKVIDSTDDWQNVCGFMPNPEMLFWMIEAAWVVSGRSYIYQSDNKYGVKRIFKVLSPKSVSYDSDKNLFTRKVDGHDRTYPSAIDDKGIPFKGESIVPLWMPDPDVEKGPPLKYPGKAALQAMGVLFNMDEAATGFFKRGMLHAMLFSVPPGTQPSDKEMLDDKIKNFLSGIKNAWRSILINFDIVKMTDIGGDLSSLANIPLTKEKREDISIALGIPMSKLFTESAAGLGGKGVVDADDRRLILDTGVPEWTQIARELNQQVFIPLGYRLVDNHEQMPQLQIEQTSRAQTFTAYFTALNTNVDLAIALAAEEGMDWSDDFKNAMTKIKTDKEAAAAEAQKNMQPQGQPGQDNITAANPNAQTANADMVAEKIADLKRYERKAIKNIGKAVSFESEVIPAETMAYLETGLPGCKTAEDVKALFAGIEEEKIIPMPDSGLFALAAAINKATKVAESEPDSQPASTMPLIYDPTGTLKGQFDKYNTGVTQEILQVKSNMEGEMKDVEDIVRKMSDNIAALSLATQALMESANKPVIMQPNIMVDVPQQKPADIIVNEREQLAPVVNMPQQPEPAKGKLKVIYKDGKIDEIRRI